VYPKLKINTIYISKVIYQINSGYHIRIDRLK